MKILALGIVVAAASLVGCGSGSNDPGTAVDAKDAAIVQSARDVAQKAGGKWDSLTPDQQKMFLDRSHGNLDDAKKTVAGMGRPMPKMNPSGG